MEYLKIWTSFREVISLLNDSEKGRLFDAMLLYAENGEQPDLKGNERYIWPSAKQAIDRAVQKAETLRQNGNKGGRPPKPNETNENQTEPNETNENQTKAYKDNNKEKEKKRVSKDTQNAHTRELFDRFWSAYPRHTGKQAAEKAFLRLNPDDDLLGIMLMAITAWSKSEQWTKDGGQYIPHPATWINGRRWEDELPKAAGAHMKTVTAQAYTQRDYTEEELDSISADLMEEARRIARGETA